MKDYSRTIFKALFSLQIIVSVSIYRRSISHITDILYLDAIKFTYTWYISYIQGGSQKNTFQFLIKQILITFDSK